MKKLLVMLYVCLVLVSCTSEPKRAVVECSGNAESEAVEVKNDIREISAVSEFAQPCFLEPLDKYSWEKEYNTEFVVLHFTSNVVADRENPYDMEKIRQIFVDNEISVHYIVDRSGNAFCYIPETHSAWHAGAGEYNGDEKYTNKMNKYSVGIEIVAVGSENDMAQYLTREEYRQLDESLCGFTDAQYETLKKLVPDICQRNGIVFDRQHVIGHGDYNKSKSDPGELFDWDRFFE